MAQQKYTTKSILSRLTMAVGGTDRELFISKREIDMFQHVYSKFRYASLEGGRIVNLSTLLLTTKGNSIFDDAATLVLFYDGGS